MLTLTAPCSEQQGSWSRRAAGLWVGRPQGFEPLRACSPSASTPTTSHNFPASSCLTGMLHTAHFFAVCSSQVKHPRGEVGGSAPTCTCCPLDGCFVRQVRAHFSWGKLTNSPSALSTARNSGLISRPTSRTCRRSPGSTPGLLWAANHTCLCAGSLLQVAESRCGGVGGKRR